MIKSQIESTSGFTRNSPLVRGGSSHFPSASSSMLSNGTVLALTPLVNFGQSQQLAHVALHADRVHLRKVRID
jgi:hypothetical protein